MKGIKFNYKHNKLQKYHDIKKAFMGIAVGDIIVIMVKKRNDKYNIANWKYVIHMIMIKKEKKTANILPNGNMWGGSGRSGGKAEVAQENKLLLLIEKGNRDLDKISYM